MTDVAGPPGPDRRLQRGRRPGHPGPAGLAGRHPPRWRRGGPAGLGPRDVPRARRPGGGAARLRPRHPRGAARRAVGYWLGNARPTWRLNWPSRPGPADLLEEPRGAGRSDRPGSGAAAGQEGPALSPGLGFTWPAQPWPPTSPPCRRPRSSTGRQGHRLRLGRPHRVERRAWCSPGATRAAGARGDPVGRGRSTMGPPKPKPTALSDLATAVPPTHRTRRSARPAAAQPGVDGPAPPGTGRPSGPGGGPAGGSATSWTTIAGWSLGLDHSFVALQGPPGTGKTSGAPTSCGT